MDAIWQRLDALEMKVRETLAELDQARRDRQALEETVRALHLDLGAREQEIGSLKTGREQDAADLARLRAEREEIRGRVEGLLEEIARLETALQSVGTAGATG
jgi:chromosome segregation ATPase